LRQGLKKFFSTDLELKNLIKGAKKVIEVGEVTEIGLFRLKIFDQEY